MIICSIAANGQTSDTTSIAAKYIKEAAIKDYQILSKQLYDIEKKLGFEIVTDSLSAYQNNLFKYSNTNAITAKMENLRAKIEKRQLEIKNHEAQEKLDTWSLSLDDEDDIKTIVEFAAIIKRTGAKVSITENIIICTENGNEHVILFSEKDKEASVTYSENN